MNRLVLTRALTGRGHTVVAAEDGVEAMEKLHTEPFDVILLDIVMPRKDGFETLAEIKADPALRELPVIVISGVEDVASVVRCIEMGALDHLPKPFEPALLHARLRAALTDTPGLVVERGVVRDASHVGAVADTPEATALVAQFAASPYAPPSPAETGAPVALVRACVREGLLVDVDGTVFAASALASAREQVVALLAEKGTITVADVRDALGSSRKFTLPIVNWLDRNGVTRRRGDDRIPGPTSGLT